MANPYNAAEYDRSGMSLVDDILKAEPEAEVRGRVAVAGGQRQPAAPNVPLAAMKSVLPEVEGENQGQRTERVTRGKEDGQGACRATGHMKRAGDKGGGQT